MEKEKVMMSENTIMRNYEKELQITHERLYEETMNSISTRAALEDLHEENKLLKQEVERLKAEKEDEDTSE